MSYFSDEEFDELATTLRVALGVDEQVYLDVIYALKRMKHCGYIVDYVRVPDAMMLDDEGKFDPDQRKIFFRNSVFVGAEQKKERARFTVAHEMAHSALNHQQIRKRSLSAATFEKAVTSIRRDEVQANKLAGAILAPFRHSNFSIKTTPPDLVDRFGLSSVRQPNASKSWLGYFDAATTSRVPSHPG